MISVARRGDAPVVPAAILFGCLALAARPASLTGVALISVAVGAIGVMGPLRPTDEWRAPLSRWTIAVLAGVLAFAAARAFGPRAPGVPVGLAPLLAVAVASVTEEIFFRRLVYGWLAAWGPAFAIAGGAAVFAAVHIPAYGVDILPLNVAAGILFGWQRWATGGWSAPALTHLAANLLQVG